MGWWWWCCPIYSIQSAPTATNTAIILLYTLIAFNKMAAAEEQTQYPGITRPMPPKPQAQKQFQEHSNQVREQGRFNQLRAPKYGQRSEEEKLLDYLFETYNPSARPVLDSSKTVNVNITLSLLHIQDLNVRNQILTATGLLILEWTDERLTWMPSDFNLTDVVLEAKKLWVPEFAVINGADEIYSDYSEFRAIITHDGRVHWEPGGIFKTMCQIDITYFPFDDQFCSILFGAWSYHTTKMNLTNSTHTVNMDSYDKNGEWEILATTASRGEFSYDCCPNEKFSYAAFRLHMRRRYTFYVMNVILPSMVTSILLLSIFYCPPSQKVQIGVVVLLSFRIFLLNVTDSIPKTSDHIPLLGIYLTCTMAITTLSMVLTVMVLNLHSISDRPVPRWMRVIILDYLAKLFCKCDYKVNTETDRDNCRHQNNKHHNSKHRQMNINSVEQGCSNKKKKQSHLKSHHIQSNFSNSLLSLHRLGGGGDESDAEQVPIIALNGGLGNGGAGDGIAGADESNTGFVYVRNNTPLKYRTHRSPVHHHNHENYDQSYTLLENKPDYSKDWQKLAEVVDRLFFWIFLIAILAISLLLFHPLAKDSMHTPPIN